MEDVVVEDEVVEDEVVEDGVVEDGAVVGIDTWFVRLFVPILSLPSVFPSVRHAFFFFSFSTTDKRK